MEPGRPGLLPTLPIFPVSGWLPFQSLPLQFQWDALLLQPDLAQFPLF